MIHDVNANALLYTRALDRFFSTTYNRCTCLSIIVLAIANSQEVTPLLIPPLPGHEDDPLLLAPLVKRF